MWNTVAKRYLIKIEILINMIKNIVFDMGNVLVKWAPETFIKAYSEQEKEHFRKEIYYSENWLRLDRGELSEEELTELVKSRIPSRYHSDAEKLIRWYDLSSQIDGMEQLVLRLKNKGYNIYLLSNTSQAFYKFRELFPVIKHFDGTFISADYGILKPDRQIFRLFCNKFSVIPSECVFIDDSPANVKSAAEEGFSGIVFNGNAEELKRELVNLNLFK